MNWLEDPVLHIAVLLALCWFSRHRVVQLIAAGYVCAAVLTPFPFWLIGSLENKYPPVSEPVKKQAAVVLTGGTIHKLNKVDQFEWLPSVDRAMEAIRLYKKGIVSLIIVTGVEQETEAYKLESDSVYDLAKELGVPESDIILEKQGRTTYENGVKTLPILRDKNIEDFYLVTTAAHMPRSMMVFEKLGLRPSAYPVDHFHFEDGWRSILTVPSLKLVVLKYSLHEYLGLLWYRIRGRI